MKKIVVLLAVFALAAPVYAFDDVNLILSQVKEGGKYRVTVDYDASGASSFLRGIAFDVECDFGAIIEDIKDYKAESGNPSEVFSTKDNPGLGIYMESMVFIPDPNTINDPGDPQADDRDSLPGVGTSGMTVCLAALFDPCDTDAEFNAPAPTGTLFSFLVSKPCVITCTSDTETRGGPVLGDGTEADLVVAPYVVAWNYTGICHGDGNDDLFVDLNDFIILRDSYLAKYPGDYDSVGGDISAGKYNPAADFNMNGTVDLNDFILLRDSYLAVPVDDCTQGTWPPS
jgi:hypothetical protein